MARNLLPAVLLVVIACGGASSRAQFSSTRPIPETIDCLSTALDSAGYKVIRADRRRGQLEGRREGAAPAQRTDLTEYKRGDRLEIDAATDKTSYTIVPSSYIETRSQVGPRTEYGAASATGEADAAFFGKRCGS